MDKEIVKQDIGPETKFDLKLVGGNLVVELKYEGAGGVASVSAGITAEYFIDKLAALIPGTLDDAVLGLVKAALKA